MNIGVIKSWAMFASFCFIFWWDLYLCYIVSGNIGYVKSALKTHDKSNGKTNENGFVY